MFREKFILTFILTFVLEVAALGAVLLIWHNSFRFWLWNIWLSSLIVAAGLGFCMVIYLGWDYLHPTESRLPVYLGLAAALFAGLAYQGITLLTKIF